MRKYSEEKLHLPLEIFMVSDPYEAAYKNNLVAGIRVGLFTPDMAFEAIVKTQIGRLREPSLKCIDLVVQELTNVVRAVTEKVM